MPIALTAWYSGISGQLVYCLNLALVNLIMLHSMSASIQGFAESLK